jgi:predicted lipoprotein with Yx(FWY)xxD motif
MPETFSVVHSVRRSLYGCLVLLSTQAMVITALARIRRIALAASAFAMLTIALSACGSSGGGSANQQTFRGPAYEVTTSNVSSLGTILVDGDGFSLYLFEPDHQSGQSHCFDPCAVEWAPLTLPSGMSTPLSGPGVSTSKLSTTRRPGGVLQLTYNGWPLYTWAQDLSPGQATGQGLNNLGGLWYVMDPEGSAITLRP